MNGCYFSILTFSFSRRKIDVMIDTRRVYSLGLIFNIRFFQESCNKLAISWTGSESQNWNILVSQISCTAEWKPNEGCLQWFTGTSGTVYSYNYNGI